MVAGRIGIGMAYLGRGRLYPTGALSRRVGRCGAGPKGSGLCKAEFPMPQIRTRRNQSDRRVEVADVLTHEDQHEVGKGHSPVHKNEPSSVGIAVSTPSF